MKTGPMSFNTYLLAFLVVFAAGCETTGADRKGSAKFATLRLHLEANPDGTDRSAPVPIHRERPVLVNVEKNPFLHEGNIAQATLVEELGSFAIAVRFDRQGAMVLENISSAYKGKHIAIFSQFGETRWLAAPRMTRQITDGVLVFTPDATREEAERIVRGLNQVAAKLKKKK